jgi:hypothetical protein
MYIRIFFTREAFVTCSPINSNTKGINNHMKEVINFVYNLAHYDSTTKLTNDNTNEMNDNANEDNATTSTTSNSTTTTSDINENNKTTTTTPNPTTTSENETTMPGEGETDNQEGENDSDLNNEYHFDPLLVYSSVKPNNKEPQLDPGSFSLHPPPPPYAPPFFLIFCISPSRCSTCSNASTLPTKSGLLDASARENASKRSAYTLLLVFSYIYY